MGATAVLPPAGRAVLRRAHRLTASQAFGDTVRRGVRAGGPRLVLHLAVPAAAGNEQQPRIGFVVGRTVGPAVRRNLVKRRLRALVRERIDRLPASAVLVVRALPAAAGAPYDMLGRDLDTLLDRVLRRTAEKAAS